LYLVVSLLIHLAFFLITFVDNIWATVKTSTCFYYGYFTRASTTDLDRTPSFNLQQSHVTRNIMTTSTSSSSLLSHIVPESEATLTRTIRSFGLFLCTGVFISNWLCLGIFLLPAFYPHRIQFPSTFCLVQSFLLHVFALFHLHLTIGLRLLWYVCFTFDHYWQTITYRRLLTLTLGVFICLCVFTWPSVSNEWASIRFDHILDLCVVNYTFRLSYTLFVLSLTCLIPFLLLIVSHHRQTKSIQRRILKYSTTLKLGQHEEKLIIDRKNLFQCASSIVLVWTFISIVLLICIHVPAGHERSIKSVVYHVQMCAFLFDPILYTFVFRSLSIITLLRPTPIEL
jgi:hypothetical protein